MFNGQLVQAISYAVALSCGIYEIKVQLRLFDAFSKTKGNFLLAPSAMFISDFRVKLERGFTQIPRKLFPLPKNWVMGYLWVLALILTSKCAILIHTP